ncbi:MAG: hypothetical protein WCJ57_03290 [Candidatus Falkowbacteria bacterium]
MESVDGLVKKMLSQEQVSGHIKGKACQIIISTLQKKTNSVFINIIPAGDEKQIPTNIDELTFYGDSDKNTSIRALLKYEAIKKGKQNKK